VICWHGFESEKTRLNGGTPGGKRAGLKEHVKALRGGNVVLRGAKAIAGTVKSAYDVVNRPVDAAADVAAGAVEGGYAAVNGAVDVAAEVVINNPWKAGAFALAVLAVMLSPVVADAVRSAVSQLADTWRYGKDVFREATLPEAMKIFYGTPDYPLQDEAALRPELEGIVGLSDYDRYKFVILDKIQIQLWRKNNGEMRGQWMLP